ncbi:unnamed protein product, partial [Mesorhabditis belari]|uniref:Uncharacterized protein n=1 Tax=Mesorhabditis belari TaxID=2138241 RepID=A0AAF3FCT6_9BILA
MLPYQFGWFQFTGQPNSAPFLLFLSVGRQHCLAVSCISCLFILVERIAATWFLLDYEEKKRLYISAMLLVVQFFGCFGVVGAILIGAAYNIPLTILIVAPPYAMAQIFIAILHHVLRWYNKRVIRQISKNPFKGKRYSLTTRYQLEENLRGLEEMTI